MSTQANPTPWDFPLARRWMYLDRSRSFVLNVLSALMTITLAESLIRNDPNLGIVLIASLALGVTSLSIGAWFRWMASSETPGAFRVTAPALADGRPKSDWSVALLTLLNTVVFAAIIINWFHYDPFGTVTPHKEDVALFASVLIQLTLVTQSFRLGSLLFHWKHTAWSTYASRFISILGLCVLLFSIGYGTPIMSPAHVVVWVLICALYKLLYSLLHGRV